MELTLVGLAVLLGYLMGSFSAARMVVRIFAPDHVMEGIRAEVPDGEAYFESDVISATTVRLHLGSRYGCLTSILDMLKAALPALIFLAWKPDRFYYLIAAGMATVGHIWPIYYRFKGGRGMSPILGGLLVVDWLGVLVTQLIGAVTGLVVNNIMIMIGTGTALMIPWIWVRTRSWPEVLYTAAMNILFWAAMLPEVQEFIRLKREGKLEEFSASSQIRIVGRRGDEVTESRGMASLRRRLIGLFRGKSGS